MEGRFIVEHRNDEAILVVSGEVDLMNAAAKPLAGEHDFAAFTVIRPEVSSTIRTIESLAVERDGSEIRITVTANGFLRYMVRRIAGSLIEAGRGKLSADDVRRSLEPDFAPARWTAPARGLTLLRVRYSGANIRSST